MKFASTGDKGFSLSLTSIFPTLSASGGSGLNSFGAVSTGSFYSELTSGGGVGGVPEPASWALMLVGVGLLGGSLRDRRSRLTALST